MVVIIIFNCKYSKYGLLLNFKVNYKDLTQSIYPEISRHAVYKFGRNFLSFG